MIYIFLALVFYTVAILLGAAASRNANTNLVSAIMNTISAVIPVALVASLLSKKFIISQKFGVLMAVAGGVCVALFVMAINKAYSFNKVGIVAPIVFGGAIFLSTILSYFIFKEKVSQLQFIGLIILGVGFGFVIYARATGR